MTRTEIIAMLKDWIGELEDKESRFGPMADYGIGGHECRWWYREGTDTVLAKVRFEVIDE